MEELTTKCLVVRSSDYGDNDRLLTLITEDKGKLFATIKGGKSLRSRFTSVSEQFTYATISLRRKTKFFYVFDAELIDDFYPLREDLVKVALASYICDVASELSPEGINDPSILKLTLNALYAMAYKDVPCELIKASYEFKAAVLSGFMPDLSACAVCGKESDDEMFIDAASGTLICSDCITLPESRTGVTGASVLLPVTKDVLLALRYLEEAPVQKFLSFRLSGDVGVFSNFCEKYIACHLEKELYTLTFYRSVK